jgi:hypothetical protein
MYRTLLAAILLAVSVAPTWARGSTSHATMHRLGSYHRHHHAAEPAAALVVPRTSASTATS